MPSLPETFPYVTLVLSIERVKTFGKI